MKHLIKFRKQLKVGLPGPTDTTDTTPRANPHEISWKTGHTDCNMVQKTRISAVRCLQYITVRLCSINFEQYDGLNRIPKMTILIGN